MGSADLADGVEYPAEADVLILPHQGRSDIDSHNEAIIKKLKPKRVLLDHYDDAFPPVSERKMLTMSQINYIREVVLKNSLFLRFGR